MLKAIGEINKKNNEVNKLLFEFEKIDRKLDEGELVFTKTDGSKYDLKFI